MARITDTLSNKEAFWEKLLNRKEKGDFCCVPIRKMEPLDMESYIRITEDLSNDDLEVISKILQIEDAFAKKGNMPCLIFPLFSIYKDDDIEVFKKELIKNIQCAKWVLKEGACWQVVWLIYALSVFDFKDRTIDDVIEYMNRVTNKPSMMTCSVLLGLLLDVLGEEKEGDVVYFCETVLMVADKNNGIVAYLSKNPSITAREIEDGIIKAVNDVEYSLTSLLESIDMKKEMECSLAKALNNLIIVDDSILKPFYL